MWFARFLWLILVCTADAWGQVEAYWQADTTEVTLGQPVDLRLVMRFSSDIKPDEPDLTNLLSAASYRPEGRLGPEVIDGLTHVTLTGTVRYYELGEQAIPDVEVVFVRESGDTLSAVARGLSIEVISVLEEGDQALRDIKPPVVIEGGIPLWMAVAVALLTLVALGWFIAYWVRRRRWAAAEGVPEPEPVDDPVMRAALFETTTPLPDIDNLRPLPPFTRDDAGPIVVQFRVNGSGKVTDLERLLVSEVSQTTDNESDTDASDAPELETDENDASVERLLRKIRRTRFRPRFEAGEPVGTDMIVWSFDLASPSTQGMALQP